MNLLKQPRSAGHHQLPFKPNMPSVMLQLA